MDSIQGDSIAIVQQKCYDAAEIVLKNNNNIDGIIIEETAFCFNALDGLPGPFINSFLNQMCANDLIKMIQSYDDKTAYFLSTFGLAFYKNDKLEVKTFQGLIVFLLILKNYIYIFF